MSTFVNNTTEFICIRCGNKMKFIPTNEDLNVNYEDWLCCPHCFFRTRIKEETEKIIA